MDLEFIERKMIVGLIVSTEYLQRMRQFWKYEIIESQELRTISKWCWDHFEKYGTAPDSDIESIFVYHRDSGHISADQSELISKILSRASADFGRGEKFGVTYLYDQTVEYFKKREIIRHTEKVQDLIDSGRVLEAEKLQKNFQASTFEISSGVSVGSELYSNMLMEVFNKKTQNVLSFPGDFGKLVNEHMVRSGFVAFMGAEKRGKTFLLLEMALRAVMQNKSNVAFFAAGDMTEKQIAKRISTYLTLSNENEKYCKEHWAPRGDCVLNQLNLCKQTGRASKFGVYSGLSLDSWNEDKQRYEEYDNLVHLAKNNKNYKNCNGIGCEHRKGTVWLSLEEEHQALNADLAINASKKFFDEYKRILRIKSYGTGTLTTAEMNRQLNEWEKEDGFVPEIVICDYADIMSADEQDFRHRQNQIWMGLRGIGIVRDCLVITATQADAESYKLNKLNLSNFSNDKRKYSHVTAMWSLNGDPKGREKKLGILRIGELLVREGEFDPEGEVCILQDLSIGRPFIGSYKK